MPLVVVLFLLASCRPSLIGGERGLDHVGIVVPDLQLAKKTFKSTLGFGAFEEGTLPNGIANINYYFEDGTYLETMHAWDAEKAAWLARAPEGPSFFVLSVSSLADASAFLNKRGLRTGPAIDGSISTARAQSHWQTMAIDPRPFPFFFIAYAQPKRSEQLKALDEARKSGRVYKHPNTALGIKAVWHAVADLASSRQVLVDMGLSSAGEVHEPRLSIVGEKFRAGEGFIVLVTGPPPGLLGVSVQVADFAAGKRFAQRAEGALVEGDGAFGKSVWVKVHNTWLEFFASR